MFVAIVERACIPSHTLSLIPLFHPIDLTGLLLTLNDSHVETGFTTKLLEEAIRNCSSTLEHVEYLLFDMKVESSIKPHFKASGLSTASILRKRMFSLQLFQKLIECGLVITGQCQPHSVCMADLYCEKCRESAVICSH